MHPKQRLSFVIEKLSGRKGGAERVLFDVCNALADRGHSISILHWDETANDLPYTAHPNIDIRNLHPRGALIGKAKHAATRLGAKIGVLSRDREWTLRYGGFGRAIANDCAAHATHALVAFMPPAMAAVALADTPKHVTKIASVHSSPFNEYENPVRWGMGTYGMQRRLDILDSFDKITVLLPAFKAWYKPALQEKITVLPNMVYPVERQWHAQPARSRNILSVGHLVAGKRHSLLLDAWFAVASDFPEWTLQIYGKGPLHNALAQKIRAQGKTPESILKGTVNDMQPLYQNAALLAHPAQQEGFGLVAAEALSASLPVVAFADCPGINTLVAHDTTGILVPSSDCLSESLANALRALMHDDTLRARLGASGPDSMLAYKPETITDAWEALLCPSTSPSQDTP